MKSKKKTLTIVIEKSSTGFSAYAKEMNGIYSAAETLEELKLNIQEVLEMQVEYLQEQGEKITVEDFQLNYVLDLEAFFDYFSVLNKTTFAEKYANVNASLFRQYTKGLAPLSGDKMAQISKGLHKLADELCDLTFA